MNEENKDEEDKNSKGAYIAAAAGTVVTLGALGAIAYNYVNSSTTSSVTEASSMKVYDIKDDVREQEKAKEEQATQNLFNIEQARGMIKLCPFCGGRNNLISGCNYVTCLCKGGFNGKAEFCWKCNKAKYKPDPKNINGGCCNDKTHNSH